MHSRRQTRSPEGEPRSKASENRKETTRWSSILALVTMFVVFLYIVFAYDWYDTPQKRMTGVVAPTDIIRFKTDLGDIRVVVRPDIAPKTVDHFLKLVQMGFYDGCGFYRAERGFVLQGGAQTVDKQVKESPLPNLMFEYGMLNEKGTIAMARTDDIDSANTEYFFNLADNSEHLGQNGDNPGYTAFGEVVVGLELLEKLSTYPTVNQGGLHMLRDVIPVQIVQESRLQK